MLTLFVLLFCSVAINAQLEEAHPAPEPYSFAYSAPNEDGSSSSREEIGDANGRITGFYNLLGEDGQQRRVDYVADENGFRAVVKTNEIGTESKNAANAEYLSSAPTAAELVAQYEASGAGKARIQAQRVLRTQAVNAGLNVGLVAPVQRQVVQVAQAGLNAGGLAGGLAVGLAPAGGVSRFQTLRTVGAVGQPLALSGGLSGGLIGSQAIRTQSVGGLVGGGLVGVAPFGGSVQRLQAFRTQSLGGLNGIGLSGLVPVGGLQTIQTSGLQGLAPLGGSVQRLQAFRTQTLGGLNGIGLSGLVPVDGLQTTQISGLQGLQGTGGNFILLPGNAVEGGNSVVRLVSGGLQGFQGLNSNQGKLLFPQTLGSEEIAKKS